MGRRLRRAWGKRYNVKSGITVNQSIVKEYAVRASFHNAHGQKLREQKQQFVEDQFLRLFGTQMAEWYELYHSKRHQSSADNITEYGEPCYVDPKILIQWKIDKLKEEELDLTNHITILREPDLYLQLFYHSRLTRWMFLETDMVEGVQRKSIIYKTRQRAMIAVREGRVIWKETSPIESPVSS